MSLNVNGDLGLSMDYLPKKNKEDIDYFTKLLCFGCRRHVENSKNSEIFFESLPDFMKNGLVNIEKEMEKKNLNEKEKLKEFFLSEKEKY